MNGPIPIPQYDLEALRNSYAPQPGDSLDPAVEDPSTWDVVRTYSEMAAKQSSVTAVQMQLSNDLALSDIEAEMGIVPLTAEEANKQFGIPGVLQFDEIVSPGVAKRKKERAEEQMRWEAILEKAGAGESVLGFIAALGTNIVADPIGTAFGFIPFVGGAKYARMLKLAGPVAVKMGIGAVGKRALVRAGVGAVEGAAGNALLEPFLFLGNKELGYQYGWEDSAFSIAGGAGAGAGLRSVGGLLADSIAVRKLSEVNVEARTEAINVAVYDMGNGNIPRVDEVVLSDTPKVNRFGPDAVEVQPGVFEASFPTLQASESWMVRTAAISGTPLLLP